MFCPLPSFISNPDFCLFIYCETLVSDMFLKLSALLQYEGMPRCEVRMGIIRDCGVRYRRVKLVFLCLVATAKYTCDFDSFLDRGRLCFVTRLCISYLFLSFTNSKNLYFHSGDRSINLMSWWAKRQQVRTSRVRDLFILH